MSFTSFEFLTFFVVVLALLTLTSRFLDRENNTLILLIINYVFYIWWDYRFALLLGIMSIVVYWSALSKKKNAYKIGVIAPLVVLCFFKYFNFFLDNLGLQRMNIVIPVGISFYTFEAISYVLDVRNKKIKAEKDFLSFAAYLSFFPNIVSGPIARAGDLLVQIKEGRKVEWQNIMTGIQIMAIGFFKKMVIADRIAVFVDDVFRSPNAFSSLTVLFAVLSYSIQIYMDFSGYSDIAIGCAKCLGYEFKKNFNLPYISKSVSEFWRRWHISLSTWFRDYVYIPLGGNRLGKGRQYLNQMIVMTLSGLWHGADWTFVFWGGLNGLLMIVEKMVIKDSDNKLFNALRIIMTYVLISFTWLFFRADGFGNAIDVLRAIFAFKSGIVQPYLWSMLAFAVLTISTIAAVNKSEDKNRVDGYYPIQDLTSVKGMTIFFIFVGLIICLAYTNANPFVYLQF